MNQSPKDLNMKYEYDVALSFAGEDRDYVHNVATILRDLRVAVFYDEFEKENLWGKNLYDYLSKVYYQKCKYTVVFISEHYGKKLWTDHERQSAQARAFEENREYILPARFDDTEIPGILPTTGYLGIDKMPPEELAEIIQRKVMEPNNSELKLIDFFPKIGRRIVRNEVNEIFLKYNNPIDRDSQGLIKNYYIQANTNCQWNTCGWIEFAEADTLLKWHINEDMLMRDEYHGPLDIDYPRFEIQIGQSKGGGGLKDVFGNKFPYFVIPVRIIEG